ncbi:MAG: DUF4416 family protein [Syntrophorhabdaceae bacterium]|nr:DUF4416 family protein [Syntrophorhabdaceae bacterium]
MGSIRTPKPVMFFASIIFSEQGILNRARDMVSKIIGKELESTPYMPFHHTDYYNDEMGTDLMRLFILYEGLIDRQRLPEIKEGTNEIELILSNEGKRRVNIDPGYISLENLILATTKGYTHRIYIDRGIYGDLTLMFYKGTFRPLEWTYPDYREEKVIDLFNGWRALLKEGIAHYNQSIKV